VQSRLTFPTCACRITRGTARFTPSFASTSSTIPYCLARIIDEADTVQEALVEPAAAGLDLICEGIRLTSLDDPTALERGAMVYEALYARLKSEVKST
jgi:hypothetical protein